MTQTLLQRVVAVGRHLVVGDEDEKKKLKKVFHVGVGCGGGFHDFLFFSWLP